MHETLLVKVHVCSFEGWKSFMFVYVNSIPGKELGKK